MITVITPTTGKASLLKLIDSIDRQTVPSQTFHLLLWDDYRDSDLDPFSLNGPTRFSIVAPPGSGRNGQAPGSLLRSIGLMAARTPWVTFADDDVWWDLDYLETVLPAMGDAQWITVLRKIYTAQGEYLGVDRFESVGDAPTRRVPYEMCDNNTMLFRREYGVRAAHIYRETDQYNDDRLMYQYLKDHAGARYFLSNITVNHVCPKNLTEFFQVNCDEY
jgi:hypothetical protein